MKIHSMYGCSCWNWPLAHSKAMRDVMRKSINRSGHCEGCSKQEASILAEKLFGEAPVKDPRKVCCYLCGGQCKHASSGVFVGCLACLKSGQVWREDRRHEEYKMERHDTLTSRRKWQLWLHVDDAKARLKEAAKDATDDQIEELELSLKELMDHLRMQFSEMRVARWHRRGGRRDVAIDIEHRAGLR